MLRTPRIYGDRNSSACVLAIGVFDGVHIGHRAIIEQAVSQARELGVDAVALTFDPHPAALLAPGRQPDQLTTLEHRARLLHSLGVASLVAWPFDAQFAALSPGDFEQDILRDYFHTKSIWVGENFTYGHKAAGNPSTLRASQFLAEVEINVQELYSTGTQVASSTVIRNDIEVGDVYRAWQLLQRPHVVEGVVVVDVVEETIKLGAEPTRARTWWLGEISRLANEKEVAPTSLITTAFVAEIIALISSGDLTDKLARQVVEGVVNGEGSPKDVIEKRGLKVVSDDSALMVAIEAAIAAQPDTAERIRGGNIPAAGALIGAVMKATGGQADAAKVRELLLKHLGQG